MSVILERDNSNQTIAFYTRGLFYLGGIEGIVSRTDISGNSYYLYDGLGSVTSLTDLSGQAIQTYIYDAFGNILQQGGAAINPYQFQSKQASSSTGLVYFGARWYNPIVGRWLTPDPTGMIDGPNLYVYLNNNPVNLIDPWGLCKEKSRWEWGPGNWLWQYFYGNPQLVDPEFRMLIRDKFQEYRLPGVKWLSLLELPWGPPVSYGLAKGGQELEYLTAREATRLAKGARLSRSTIYMTGYRPVWFGTAKVVKGSGHALAIGTAFATGVDIGTWLYSYQEAVMEYGK